MVALGSQETMDHEQADVEFFFRALLMSSATLMWNKRA